MCVCVCVLNEINKIGPEMTNDTTVLSYKTKRVRSRDRHGEHGGRLGDLRDTRPNNAYLKTMIN